jgi:hypothetical protein
MANTFTERIKLILTGAKKATRDAKKFETGLQKIQKAAVMAGGSFFAAQGIIEGFKRSIELAGKFDNAATGFARLTSTVGGSAVSINKLRDAVDGTINDIDLMTMANQALTLGVASSTTELANMFDSAQRLGRVLGVDTKSSVESLVTGMGRQSIQMLDNLGIIVRSETAYENYKETMGIVGRELDEQEKKLAFNEEAMRQLTESVKKLGDEELTMADKISEANASWDNFLTDVGDAFNPFINIITGGVDVMKDFGLLMDDLADAEKFAPLASNVQEAKTALAEFMHVAADNHGIFEGMISSEELASLTTEEFTNRVIFFGKELDKLGFSALDTQLAFGLYFKAFADNIGNQEKSAELIDNQNVQMEKQMNFMIPFIDLNAQLGSQTDVQIKRENDLYDIEQKRLQTRKDQIDMAMALGAAELKGSEAIKKASALYVTDYIRKIVATYIFEAFKQGGFFAGLGAVATGAGFGSLVGQTINSVTAAEGFDGVVTEPTLFLAGEQGAEYVDIEPTTNEGANRGGATIIFQGNVMSQDFIEDEAIPMIREALRKGGDIGIG